MIDAPERERQHRQALLAWDDAKRLLQTAVGLGSSEEERGRSAVLGSEGRAGRKESGGRTI